MWCEASRYRWLKLLLIVSMLCMTACSTQRQDQQEANAVNTDDPFDDPFFTQPPEWEASVLQQSEVLTEEPGEPEQPRTLVEKGEGIIFSTLIVGASLAKMALPFIGLGF
jgi:hypothetical protein